MYTTGSGSYFSALTSDFGTKPTFRRPEGMSAIEGKVVMTPTPRHSRVCPGADMRGHLLIRAGMALNSPPRLPVAHLTQFKAFGSFPEVSRRLSSLASRAYSTDRQRMTSG
jgi:hypothetical protein